MVQQHTTGDNRLDGELRRAGDGPDHRLLNHRQRRQPYPP
uniref:Pk3 n=1 Tax=Arundo donax TaxID=35708 RepID=A0A0A9B5R7_ARUDO